MLNFTENKRSTEDIINILHGNGDDAVFYKIALIFAFNVFGSFEVREDIEIPANDNEGVVLSFYDGRISYFKIQSEKLTDDEYKSILNVCYFLQDKFGGNIESYVLCCPEIEIKFFDGIERDGITVMLASLEKYDGDAVVDKLTNKLKNKEEFTIKDHIYHILLPYMGYKDRNEFLPKFQHYMMEVMLDNAEKNGIEVVRF